MNGQLALGHVVISSRIDVNIQARSKLNRTVLAVLVYS